MTACRPRLLLAAVASGALIVAAVLAASIFTYDGRRVTISGEWAEARFFAPGDASVAHVIADDVGRRLLLVPGFGTDVPRLSEDSVVRVHGTARGLLLSADGRDILVSAPRADLDRVTSGERVHLERLSGLASETLEHAFASNPPGRRAGSPATLERLPRDPGDPSLLFRDLTGEPPAARG